MSCLGSGRHCDWSDIRVCNIFSFPSYRSSIVTTLRYMPVDDITAF